MSSYFIDRLSKVGASDLADEAALLALLAAAIASAQAWAESPTSPDPLDGAAQSAKTWAEDAIATLLGHLWYISDTATSVTIGVSDPTIVTDPGPSIYDSILLEIS